MRKLIWSLTLVLGVISLAASTHILRSYPDPEGRMIDVISVPGIPQAQRDPGPVAQPSRNAVMLTGVPAFDWSYGCSATSAAMMAGYYDRGVFSHVYTGPTNGGVMPLNNSAWGPGECPLSATHMGYDDLMTAGHVDRFWTNNSGSDPFGTGDPTGTYYGCTADFMGTNQDWWGNSDGSTTFANYVDGSPLYDPQDGVEGPPYFRDGIHGLKVFFLSRGYSVSTNYNQYIYGLNGNANGYTYDQFKASIDAGKPVMIQIEGHSMVGIGYESASTTIYILNTWDYQIHSMTWGGVYSGMAHYGVSVIELVPPPVISLSGNQLSASLMPGSLGTDTFTINNIGTGALSYSLEQSEAPRGDDGRSIAGSTLNLDAVEYQPSATANWTFTVHNSSTDDEWLREVLIRFPEGITLNSIGNFMGGGGGDMLPYISSESGYTLVHWHSDLSNWGVVYPGMNAFAIVNVTLDDNLAGDLTLPWEIRGDVYGSDPHVLTGSIVVPQTAWPVTWFHATPVSGTVAPGMSREITGHFDATGLAPGTYQALVTVHSNDIWAPASQVFVTLEVLGGEPPQITSVIRTTEGIEVTWTGVTGANAYNIYRSPRPNSGFELIDTGTDESFVDSDGLAKAFYRVTALY